ncbi:uncharacterized protein DS421_6g190190 [Arachis hypogaea]|nr:uncharacterized protein DS421_6g190190 [Arachis hypogaea]
MFSFAPNCTCCPTTDSAFWLLSSSSDTCSFYFCLVGVFQFSLILTIFNFPFQDSISLERITMESSLCFILFM